MSIEIDVLICAYNEAQNIPRVLDSLRAQSIEAALFRVILVDNASRDETRRVVEENSHGLNLEYVYEARPGLNSARNAGYRNAKAPFVAHLDADAKAAPKWVETILQVIKEEQPHLCGGPLFPYYLTEKPAWVLDSYNTCEFGDKARYLPGEYLNGSNMVWRRQLVEQLGGFDVKAGLTGRGLVRGDETYLMLQAQKTIPHFAPFYHPEIIVHHLVRPETFSIWYWMRRSFSQGRSDCRAGYNPPVRRSRAVWLAQFLKTSGALAFRGAKAFLQRDRALFPYWENYCFEKLLPELYILGRLWTLARGQEAV